MSGGWVMQLDLELSFVDLRRARWITQRALHHSNISQTVGLESNVYKWLQPDSRTRTQPKDSHEQAWSKSETDDDKRTIKEIFLLLCFRQAFAFSWLSYCLLARSTVGVPRQRSGSETNQFIAGIKLICIWSFSVTSSEREWPLDGVFLLT